MVSNNNLDKTIQQRMTETIVNTPAKIPSTAVYEIKEAMNNLLLQIESEKENPIKGNDY